MNITKNGTTKEIQQFLKVLRQNKIIGGGEGGWFSNMFGSNNKSNNTDNLANPNSQLQNPKLLENQKIESADATKNVKTAKNINKAIEVATNVSGAIVAVELIAHAAEPLLAASGVGIPLLAILIVAKKIAKQYKRDKELQAVLYDIIIIINNCFNLEKLIKKTTAEFLEPVQQALKKELELEQQKNSNVTTEAATTNNVVSNETTNNVVSPASQQAGGDPQLDSNNDIQSSDAQPTLPTNLQTAATNNNYAQINNEIEKRIRDKLFELQKQLDKIVPKTENETEPTTMFGRVKNSVSKSFNRFKVFSSAGQLKNDIITNLSIINGLFTIYNSQFDWSIRYYESKILKYGTNGDKTIQEIWTKIEQSTEYKDYLFPTSEKTDKVVEDAAQNPMVAENINNIEKDAEKANIIEANEEANNNQANVTQPGGSGKSNKIQKRGANKRTYKHNYKNKKGSTKKRKI